MQLTFKIERKLCCACNVKSCLSHLQKQWHQINHLAKGEFRANQIKEACTCCEWKFWVDRELAGADIRAISAVTDINFNRCSSSIYDQKHQTTIQCNVMQSNIYVPRKLLLAELRRQPQCRQPHNCSAVFTVVACPMLHGILVHPPGNPNSAFVTSQWSKVRIKTTDNQDEN